MHEKRIHSRAKVELVVTCELADGSTFTGEGRDLSLGGMFVAALAQPPFNTTLTIVTLLPGGAQPTRLPAIVRWSKTDGFGVQFGLLGARETHLITKLLRP